MAYSSLKACIEDLERNGQLVRVKEEVDPYLEMASIHLRVFENNGPAILYENIRGSEFPAVSNLFGTLDRSRFIFRDTLKKVQRMVMLKGNPMQVLKSPFQYLDMPLAGLNALPKKVSNGPITFGEIKISDLPQIQCWPMDGGPFVTLPQVLTEDPDKKGIMGSNIGMYRIQLGGNDYIQDKEIGLHYQIHRGIGVHQTKYNQLGKPMKVSIFVGGPPSHSVAAVMPLPEGLPEVVFAGALGGRRFRYIQKDGYTLSAEADFVICGEVYPNENKPEGPFGDHLGYYSLTHDFPLMRVEKVYHRKGAIWPFTVVGRPPQEDTSFGALIHEITGPIIPSEIPGLHEVHAVDAAGVHPLLLAVGSERYTPYYKDRRPQEILTIANHILGFNQMSLAKFLIIGAKDDNPNLTTHDEDAFFRHILERVDWTRDLHFQTKTTIDTLDYSGSGLNSGSKVVIAAAGEKKRELATELPQDFDLPDGFANPRIAAAGIMSITAPKFESEEMELGRIDRLCNYLKEKWQSQLGGLPLIVLADDSNFVSERMGNFLWVTFTRNNPSHDVHGVDSFIEHKHWGCRGPLVIDARVKPHHAPPLTKDPEVEKKVDRLGEKGCSLHGII